LIVGDKFKSHWSTTSNSLSPRLIRPTHLTATVYQKNSLKQVWHVNLYLYIRSSCCSYGFLHKNGLVSMKKRYKSSHTNTYSALGSIIAHLVPYTTKKRTPILFRYSLKFARKNTPRYEACFNASNQAFTRLDGSIKRNPI